MKIYIGRWDLLPEDWEGYNGLVEKNKYDIIDEIVREKMIARESDDEDIDEDMIDSFTPKQFEETFNQDLENIFNNKTYWIRIF